MHGKYFSIILPLILGTLFLWTLSNAESVVKVKRVVDGDTLLLTNGEYVRLIGVDTPETKYPVKPVEYFGKEAYLFTGGWLKGKKLGLNTTRPGEIGMAVSLPMFISWMGLS